MMPGMDPKMMKQAMKRMGISQEELDVQAAVLYLDGKKLVFESPSVQKITMQGEDSFQLSGSYHEESIEATSTIDEADVAAVVEQTGASEADARAALEKANGDLASAIIQLNE